MKVIGLLNQKPIDLSLRRDLYPWREIKRQLRNNDMPSGVSEFRKILEEYKKSAESGSDLDCFFVKE